MNKRPPKVLAILPSMIASCVILVVKPLSALAEKGLIQLHIELEHKASASAIEWADVVVFCRNTEPAYGSFLNAALALGKPIIFDLDDNFWELPFDHDPELASYHRLPVRLEQLEKYLVHADLVRVYSPLMKQIVRRFNDNVKLLKAGMDFGLISNSPPRKRNDGVIHIVYATSRIIDNEYQIFLPAMKEIFERFPGAVDLSIWGCQPKELVGQKEVNIYPLVGDYEDFLREFEKARFDIGLAPLENTLFNCCKGNTKYRDYGACRIAGLYSNVDVYWQSVRHLETGMLVDDDQASWTNALIRLIFEHKLREDIQEAAHKDVYENYGVDLIGKEFLDQINGMVHFSAHPDSVVQEINVLVQKNNWVGLKLPQPQPRFSDAKLRLEVLTSDRNTMREASTTVCALPQGGSPKDAVSFQFAPIFNSADREFLLRIVDMTGSLTPISSSQSSIELVYA
jgi:glycosyltransferase involved in cell wall biosynthesis